MKEFTTRATVGLLKEILHEGVLSVIIMDNGMQLTSLEM